MATSPFSGNIGLRYVKTSITSLGYRLPYKVTIDSTSDNYTVAADPSGTIQTDTLKGEYQHWLPSLNLAFDLVEQDQAARRRLSRPVALADRELRRGYRAQSLAAAGHGCGQHHPEPDQRQSRT